MSKTINMLSEPNLRKWVEPKSIKALGLNKIKKLIEKELPPLDASKVASMKDMPINPIVQDDGKNSGMLTFQILPFIQLPFLIKLHDFNTDGKVANVIELGASDGRVVWKTLLTGAKVVANDQYSNQIKKAQNFIKSNIPDKENDFKGMAGNLFDILKQSPEYKNHFDFVYTQNVIHFFNPLQCDTFARLIWDLLKPGGKAFVTAQTFSSLTSLAQTEQSDIPSNLMKQYKEHKMILSHITKNMKEDKPFPAFIKLKYDNHKQLKSVTNPTDSEEINIDSATKIHNFFSESAFTFFTKVGFITDTITCGDRVGQEHPCYTQAEKGDKLTSLYISAVIEKPLIEDSYISAEMHNDL